MNTFDSHKIYYISRNNHLETCFTILQDRTSSFTCFLLNVYSFGASMLDCCHVCAFFCLQSFQLLCGAVPSVGIPQLLLYSKIRFVLFPLLITVYLSLQKSNAGRKFIHYCAHLGSVLFCFLKFLIRNP